MATRRLPVIQEPSGEDAEAASRPAWHWVLIGSGLLVTVRIPSVALLLMVLRGAARGEAPGPVPFGVLVAASFAAASLTSGYWVARFGPRTRLRHAAAAGVCAAVEIWLMALLGRAFGTFLLGLSSFVSLALLAAGFSALGAWLQRRRRRNASRA
jgi:hypothetical protein